MEKATRGHFKGHTHFSPGECINTIQNNSEQGSDSIPGMPMMVSCCLSFCDHSMLLMRGQWFVVISYEIMFIQPFRVRVSLRDV